MATKRKRARRSTSKRPAAKSGSIPARVPRPRMRTRVKAWLTARIVHRALRNPLVRKAVERLQRRDEVEYAAMHPEHAPAPTAQETKQPTTQQPQVIVVQVPEGTDPASVQVLHSAQQHQRPARQSKPSRKSPPQRRQSFPPPRSVSTPSPQQRPRVLPQQHRATPMVGAAPVTQPGSAPAAPEQLARMITQLLAQKGGSAIEVASLAQQFTARGVGAQAVRAALWHGHAQGWLKKSGPGRVAATARSVRAGGVPAEKVKKPGKRRSA